MPRPKPERTTSNEDPGRADRRGGYSGTEEAAAVPPPEKVPSAYPPVTARAER